MQFEYESFMGHKHTLDKSTTPISSEPELKLQRTNSNAEASRIKIFGAFVDFLFEGVIFVGYKAFEVDQTLITICSTHFSNSNSLLSDFFEKFCSDLCNYTVLPSLDGTILSISLSKSAKSIRNARNIRVNGQLIDIKMLEGRNVELYLGDSLAFEGYSKFAWYFPFNEEKQRYFTDINHEVLSKMHVCEFLSVFNVDLDAFNDFDESKVDSYSIKDYESEGIKTLEKSDLYVLPVIQMALSCVSSNFQVSENSALHDMMDNVPNSALYIADHTASDYCLSLTKSFAKSHDAELIIIEKNKFAIERIEKKPSFSSGVEYLISQNLLRSNTNESYVMFGDGFRVPRIFENNFSLLNTTELYSRITKVLRKLGSDGADVGRPWIKRNEVICVEEKLPFPHPFIEVGTFVRWNEYIGVVRGLFEDNPHIALVELFNAAKAQYVFLPIHILLLDSSAKGDESFRKELQKIGWFIEKNNKKKDKKKIVFFANGDRFFIKKMYRSMFRKFKSDYSDYNVIWFCTLFKTAQTSIQNDITSAFPTKGGVKGGVHLQRTPIKGTYLADLLPLMKNTAKNVSDRHNNQLFASKHRSLKNIFLQEIVVSGPDETDTVNFKKWMLSLRKSFYRKNIKQNDRMMRYVLNSLLKSDKEVPFNLISDILAVDSIYSYLETHVLQLHDIKQLLSFILIQNLQEKEVNLENVFFNVFKRHSESEVLERETSSIFMNEYEEEIGQCIVKSEDIKTDFRKIGALDSVKDYLLTHIIMPFYHPQWFKNIEPTSGVLFYGPPGTGKTLLAKALAKTCGVTFINVTPSYVTSKWHGDTEKMVRALFTVARKMAPSIIFVDEMDAILRKRNSSASTEGASARKLKNEFMQHWDGLNTNKGSVLVLGTTNRPMDLDEAVLRRMPYRVLIDLPNERERELILKVLLKDKVTDNFPFDEIAKKTEGYSGSDLASLTNEALIIPVKQRIKEEVQHFSGEHQWEQSLHMIESQKNKGLRVAEDDDEAENMVEVTVEHFMIAKKSIVASVTQNSQLLEELRQWNSDFSRRNTTHNMYL
ncbi:hypothetical protein PCE1_000502 [Barthelona sp. PCE]